MLRGFFHICPPWLSALPASLPPLCVLARPMHIIEIPDQERLAFRELLLLADEQMSMIERYLHRGEMFALCDPDVVSVCIVTWEGDGVWELKNLATRPDRQRQGYASRLVAFVADRYRNRGHTLLVGTGDSRATLAFYEHCGFVRSHSVPDFFVENYDHPIFEDDHMLRDMIFLKMALHS